MNYDTHREIWPLNRKYSYSQMFLWWNYQSLVCDTKWIMQQISRCIDTSINDCYILVKVKSSMARSLAVVNYHRMRGQLSTTYSNYWNSPMGNSWLQSTTTAMDNGVRDGWSNWLVAPPSSWAVPPEHLMHRINWCSSTTAGIRSCNLQHARQPPCLCSHSGYKNYTL